MKHPSIGIFLGRPDRSALLARRLRERGFEVTHYNVAGFDGEPWVRVHSDFTRALGTVLLRTNHDVYLTGLSHAPAISLYVNRRLRRKPYVFNATAAKWEMFHDQSQNRPCPRFFEETLHPFLLERTYAGASRIVCNSRFLERKIAARYPAARDRLVTIYNGIDFARYTHGRCQTIPGLEHGDAVLLSVTSLNYAAKSSALQLVLETFARVYSERPKTKLVLAAKTSAGRYESWARELVAASPARDAIFLHFNHSNVPDLLATSDLFLYATRDDSNDSLPRALIEAQAAGLPAVVTDASGCPEIVLDGETGRVVPYDVEPFSAAVLELLEAPSVRESMTRRAREVIPSLFDWDRMADQYARIFEEVTV